jgi:hypothetical protein
MGRWKCKEERNILSFPPSHPFVYLTMHAFRILFRSCFLPSYSFLILLLLLLLLLLPLSGNALNLSNCYGGARFHQTTLILPTTSTRRDRKRLIFLLGRDDSHPVPHFQQRTTSKRHDGPSHALSSSTFMLFAKKTPSSTDQDEDETTNDKTILQPQKQKTMMPPNVQPFKNKT